MGVLPVKDTNGLGAGLERATCNNADVGKQMEATLFVLPSVNLPYVLLKILSRE